MADRRRRRWIAWDASFFDGTVGVMVRDRFGPAGIAVFVAFLCACKRNLVPGQIEYGTEPDCLAQLGLPGLALVDESGEEWTLQQLWTALAAHKQCTTSKRGRLTQVRSSNWKRWQEDAISERAADKKRRSRREDTEPMDDEYEDDPAGSDAAFRPETETETETDIETNPPPQGSSETTAGPALSAEEEEENPGQEPDPETVIARLVAERRHDKRSEPIPDGIRRSKWLDATATEVRTSSGANIRALLAGGMTVEAIVDLFEPPDRPVRLVPQYPEAGEGPAPVWDIDDQGMAVPREAMA